MAYPFFLRSSSFTLRTHQSSFAALFTAGLVLSPLMIVMEPNRRDNQAIAQTFPTHPSLPSRPDHPSIQPLPLSLAQASFPLPFPLHSSPSTLISSSHQFNTGGLNTSLFNEPVASAISDQPSTLNHTTLAPTLLTQVPNAPILLGSVQHGRNVNTVRFSNNGQYLASAGGDRRIRIWHLDSVFAGDERHFIHWVIDLPESDRYVTSLAFSPGDRYLVTGTFKGDVRIWDLHNCDPEQNTCSSTILLERNYQGVAPVVRFSPDGRMLAASNYDGTVTVWNWSTRQIITVLEAETGSHDGTRIDGRFSSLSFSPDGEYLAAGSHDTSITVWTLADFERVGTIETGNGVESVDFSPNSQWLASGSLFGVKLHSIRVSRGRLRIDKTFEMEGNDRINTLAFDASGQFIFGGDNSHRLTMWDLEEEEQLAIIPSNKQHERPILSLAMTPSRNMMATGSTDGVIKLWQP